LGGAAFARSPDPRQRPPDPQIKKTRRYLSFVVFVILKVHIVVVIVIVVSERHATGPVAELLAGLYNRPKRS
jgi:hypothetical protein